MKNTVFLLGAGANLARTMINFQDVSCPSKAPLGSNFFKEALRMDKFNNDKSTEKIEPVYAYVEKYWKMDKHKLATSDFDLEECFTLLESQYMEAKNQKDNERIRDLFDIQFRLKRFVVEVLSSLKGIETHSAMRDLGQIVWTEKPIIITFNYDCFLEASIEYASGLNKSAVPANTRPGMYDKSGLSNEEIEYSNWNWNRPLGYGFKFHYVMLHDRYVHHHIRRRYETGQKYYSQQKNESLYFWPILKLHGSINWFRYIPEDSFPRLIDVPKHALPKEKRSQIILGEDDWSWEDYPELNGWPIDAILIPPFLNKEEQLRQPIYRRNLLPLWKKAKSALSSTKKLIIIGYSFPPSDFLTKKIFLEAFSENTLKELIVVNPDKEVTLIKI